MTQQGRIFDQQGNYLGTVPDLNKGRVATVVLYTSDSMGKLDPRNDDELGTMILINGLRVGHARRLLHKRVLILELEQEDALANGLTLPANN